MRRTRITRHHPQIDLVGIVDIDRARLNIAREVAPERCILETDYLRALARTRPDGVIISTPNYLHAPMTIAALQGGVHVLCEKPLALNTALALQCVQTAGRAGRKLKVGSNHRYWRGVRSIMKEISLGAIGEVTGIEGEVGYLLPDVRSDWYREQEHSGGGTIIDNTPHLIDVLSQILLASGRDRIRKVACNTSNDVLGLDVEDMAWGKLVSEKGHEIKIASTWADGAYRMNLTIQGTKGSLSLRGFDELTLETKDNEPLVRNFSDAPPLESWEMDVQAFIDSILFHAHPRASGEEGLQTVQVIEAMYASAKSNAREIVISNL